MQQYQNPRRLLELIIHCDRTLKAASVYANAKMVFVPSEKGGFITAVARASKELPTRFARHDRAGLVDEVARLATAVGAAVRDGARTSFLVVDILLTVDAGLSLRSDRSVVEPAFIQALQSRRHADVAVILHRYWKTR
ncbi:MAG: hypothetical protein ACKV0T_25925 [Planctomycetales bacterium]